LRHCRQRGPHPIRSKRSRGEGAAGLPERQKNLDFEAVRPLYVATFNACESCSFGTTYTDQRAVNSAGECHLHTVEVTGSNPVSPTRKIKDLQATWLVNPFLFPAIRNSIQVVGSKAVCGSASVRCRLTNCRPLDLAALWWPLVLGPPHDHSRHGTENGKPADQWQRRPIEALADDDGQRHGDQT
jgi:hypothetical protein